MLVAMLTASAQQTVTLKFTAKAQGGVYCPFNMVKVTDVTHGWTEYLHYPDTILTLIPHTGINEQHEKAFRLGKAYPNPFTDETHVTLEMPEAGEALIQTYDTDGAIMASQNMRLEAGTHNVKVSITKPGLTFLAVTTAQGQQVAKLMCAGNGGHNAIAVETLSAEINATKATHSTTENIFKLDDEMSYTGFIIDGTDTVTSETIIQHQNDSETITLQFDITVPGGSEFPSGILNGKFSVSEGNQVQFSKGNLQYIGSASTPYWKFADHQWEFLGDNGQGSTNEHIDRDLFGWATSGYDHGAATYQPWSTNTDPTNYYAYGAAGRNLHDETGKADWGYNAILNGGNTENLWRTMTYNEWVYLLLTRSASKVNGVDNARFAKAVVASINGLILFPDSYTHPSDVTQPMDINEEGDGGWNNNSYSDIEWHKMEEAGCVFLPAAGYRYETTVSKPRLYGSYASATYANTNAAYNMDFVSSSLFLLNYTGDLNYGESVRLVYCGTVRDSNATMRTF